MTRLLIAGATGLVGKHVLALALEDARVEHVVAPTRRLIANAHPKLRNPIIDYDRLPIDADWWAVDAAICALGTTRATAGSTQAFRSVDHDYPLLIGRLTRDQGATSFGLVSSMGADPRSRFLYTRTKGELEVAIEQLGFPSLTIVRPGLLGGRRDEFRAGERLASVLFRLAAPLLPKRLRISPATKVARVLVDNAITRTPGVRLIHASQLAATIPQ